MINRGNRINLEDIKPNTSITKAIAKVLEFKDSKEVLDNLISLDSKSGEKGIIFNNIQDNKVALKSIKRKKKVILLKFILSSIVLDNISNSQRKYKTYKKY